MKTHLVCGPPPESNRLSYSCKWTLMRFRPAIQKSGCAKHQPQKTNKHLNWCKEVKSIYKSAQKASSCPSCSEFVVGTVGPPLTVQCETKLNKDAKLFCLPPQSNQTGFIKQQGCFQGWRLWKVDPLIQFGVFSLFSPHPEPSRGVKRPKPTKAPGKCEVGFVKTSSV